MNDNQVFIKYRIIRNTEKDNKGITYFVSVISNNETDDLKWLDTELHSDPIIPCEIERKAEQALKRRLRRKEKYQNRDVIFKRDNEKENAISGIEDVGFQWHTTRKSSWDEKLQELNAFLLHAQYRVKHPEYRLCEDLEIIPTPLKSVKPILVQFEGIPYGTDLIRRQDLMKIFHFTDTTLDTWKKKHILVSRAGTNREVFYFVSHINKAFEKRFNSQKPSDKKWYKTIYDRLKHFQNI
ncbi:MAG: hypothetical protein IKO56_08125 [Alphaproteobacteria bacterium]|nr:hypothetical protein [Alphaproteobacteria bacterium]MBR6363549.1 hypothetical protein [Alphaproteobacteria bacterium]